MGWRHRRSLEAGIACWDFPARRNEFPVPDHRDERTSPMGPEAGEGDPEGSVERREARPRMAMDVDGELLVNTPPSAPHASQADD